MIQALPLELNIEHSILSPHLNETDSLNKLMHTVAQSKPNIADSVVHWDANYFSLNQSSLFSHCSRSSQENILRQLNQWSLNLVYCIEKYGLNYGAKMILSANTTEEKSLYTLFAADEVRHRLAIEPFLTADKPQDLTFHPLLEPLALVLQQGSPATMVFTIQVVLEGFGLTYYSALKEGCVTPALKNCFAEILKDEYAHHGMGVQLSQRQQLSSEDKEQIEYFTQIFIRSLIDAEWVSRAFEQENGEMNAAERLNFREQIQWRQKLSNRLTRLKELLRKVEFQGLVDRLDSKGVFQIANA